MEIDENQHSSMAPTPVALWPFTAGLPLSGDHLLCHRLCGNIAGGPPVYWKSLDHNNTGLKLLGDSGPISFALKQVYDPCCPLHAFCSSTELPISFHFPWPLPHKPIF
jgi:hypothetical protein